MAGMFSSPPPPPMPKPQPAAVMPDEQSPQVLERKRLAQLNMLERQGRESTILSQDNSAPRTGGGTPADYSRKTLGGQ